jgi:hypothetical protein
MCSGVHLADMTLWTVVAAVTATFRINRAKGEDGIDTPINVHYSSGLVRYSYLSCGTRRSADVALVTLHILIARLSPGTRPPSSYSNR